MTSELGQSTVSANVINPIEITGEWINRVNQQLASEHKPTVLEGLEQVQIHKLEGYAVVPTMINLLTDDDAEIRQASLASLVNMGKNEKLAIHAVMRSLHDSDTGIRQFAASALGKYGKRAAQAVFDLADRALNDTDPVVQRHCCQALGEIGPTSVGALPALVQLLKNGTSALRDEAAKVLAMLSPDIDMAQPALIQALNDESAEVRQHATLALGRIGAQPMNL